MKNDNLKYFKPSVLIGFVAILGIAIYLAKNQWHLSVSIVSIITMLLFVIGLYLWKYKLFIWMFWIKDFSGRYEGIIRYQYIDNNGELNTGELKHVKVINQNGFRVSVTSFTIKADGSKSSLSYNRGMHIEKTEDEQHYRLVYSYLNEGSGDQNFPPHFGTEVVKFVNNGREKFLSGGYYTDRKPFQTQGEFIDLKWVSNNLNHDY